jgi:hypothetical protein
MNRKLFALLVLAALGFGLMAGLHPCKAAQNERESRQPSCHKAVHSPLQSEVHSDSSPPGDEGDCCDTACQHACHMTAVAETGPIRFSIAPVSDAVAEVAGSGLALFAHPIDHVPLV